MITLSYFFVNLCESILLISKCLDGRFRRARLQLLECKNRFLEKEKDFFCLRGNTLKFGISLGGLQLLGLRLSVPPFYASSSASKALMQFTWKTRSGFMEISSSPEQPHYI